MCFHALATHKPSRPWNPIGCNPEIKLKVGCHYQKIVSDNQGGNPFTEGIRHE